MTIIRPAPAPAPWWVVALLVINALLLVGAGVLTSIGTGDDELYAYIYVAIAVLLPYLALALVLRLYPRPWAYGAVAMISVVVAGLLLVLWALAQIGGPSSAADLGLVLLPLFGIQAALLVWAVRRVVRHGPRGIIQVILGALLMLAWPALAGFVAMAAEVSVDTAGVLRAFSTEQELAHRMVRVQKCVLDFAAANPSRGFPAALDDMTTGAAPCLDPAALRPRRGFELTYRPAPAVNGRVPDFLIEGRTEETGEYGGSEMLADSSGLVVRDARASQRDAGLRTDGMPRRLHYARQCIIALSAGGPPPSVLTREFQERRYDTPALQRQCGSANLAALFEPFEVEFFGKQEGFRLSYLPSGGEFQIEARPVTYGETALRSYLITTDGRLFVTREDHPARTTDAEVPPCRPHDTGDCVPTPADAVPRAVFVHDNVVHAESSYALRPGVVGAPDREPGISWFADCNVDPGDLNRSAEQIPFGSPIRSCTPLRSRALPLGDRVIVRLWLKHGEQVAQDVDTIRVIR